MTQRIFLIVCFWLCAVSPDASSGEDNIVIRWNKIFLQAVRDTRSTPPVVARAGAIVHTSMFDAWAAYDTVAVGTQLGDTLRRPAAEHTLDNKAIAISFAAYRSLVDSFPGQTSVFNAVMNELGLDPANTSTDPSSAVGIGNTAAAAVLQYRHQDGSNQLGDLNPGPYFDYTSYTPLNDPQNIRDPNRWQPLATETEQPQVFLVAHWGLVKGFALGEDLKEKLLPKGPPLYPGRSYEREVQEIVDISANLNDLQKSVASYWSDGPATETPPGHWNLLAEFVSERDQNTLDEDVQLYFALNNALLDASIQAWYVKREFDYIRPASAVRFLFAGQRIRAWAGPGLGTQKIAAEDFRSYIGTPPFAEYVSGHSTFSAASAQVLKSFTRSNVFGASVTIVAGSSLVEPAVVPAQDITLSWRTFTVAADEAGISRRYGLIHFRSGDLDGRKLGRQIGARCGKKPRATSPAKPQSKSQRSKAARSLTKSNGPPFADCVF